MVKKTLIFLAVLFCGLYFWWHKLPTKSLPLQKDAIPTPTPTQIQGIILHGSRVDRRVALTFDADMTPGMLKKLKQGKVASWYNRDVINILEKEGVPATLFLTGMWAQNYPQETRQLAANPLFEIENHSYSHPSFNGRCYGLSPISDSQDDGEIEKTQEVLKKLVGEAPKFFRFPGGCYSEADLKIVEKHNLTVVQWDVVSSDAFEKDPSKIVARVLKNVQNGSIVVFHMHGGPNAPATGEALPGIISELKKRGFDFVKVSYLVQG